MTDFTVEQREADTAKYLVWINLVIKVEDKYDSLLNNVECEGSLPTKVSHSTRLLQNKKNPYNQTRLRDS